MEKLCSGNFASYFPVFRLKRLLNQKTSRKYFEITQLQCWTRLPSRWRKSKIQSEMGNFCVRIFRMEKAERETLRITITMTWRRRVLSGWRWRDGKTFFALIPERDLPESWVRVGGEVFMLSTWQITPIFVLKSFSVLTNSSKQKFIPIFHPDVEVEFVHSREVAC